MRCGPDRRTTDTKTAALDEVQSAEALVTSPIGRRAARLNPWMGAVRPESRRGRRGGRSR